MRNPFKKKTVVWSQVWPDPETSTGQTVLFTPDAVRNYLDDAIRSWREQRDEHEPGTDQHVMGVYYVDAFQSMRVSLFGEMLPV